MAGRVKGLAPLALVIGVVAFLYVEFALNFTFHWVTDGDLGIGLELPSNFHLVVPAAFVAWGMFFAAGGDNAALTKVGIGNVFGVVAAFIMIALAGAFAGLPDFWGISLWVGIMAAVLVLLAALGEWYFIPATFGAFASVVFWWLATGADGWAENGGGVGNSLAALGDPATAGSGAFGGVLSTPYIMVCVNILVTLTIGVLLGAASQKLTAAITPRPSPYRLTGRSCRNTPDRSRSRPGVVLAATPIECAPRWTPRSTSAPHSAPRRGSACACCWWRTTTATHCSSRRSSTSRTTGSTSLARARSPRPTPLGWAGSTACCSTSTCPTPRAWTVCAGCVRWRRASRCSCSPVSTTSAAASRRSPRARRTTSSRARPAACCSRARCDTRSSAGEPS